MRLSSRASLFAGAALLLLTGAAQAQVRISQIYGGGGNSGATYKNDFIEIFNAGASPVDLSTWSVQYAASSGSNWSKTNLTGSLGAGQYLLVQQAAGTGGTTDLPTPDVVGTIAMSGTTGKVALRNSTTTITAGTSCPTGADIIDFVGFGGTNCTLNTAVLTNTTAALRKTNGCTATGNNTNDFATGAPTPRNKASAVNTCGGEPVPTNPSVSVSLSPSSVQVGENFTVRGTVVFGTNPTSTGVAVAANLTPIGGAADQALFDDGLHDDGAAGDKVYGFVATVPAGTSGGTKVIGVGVADAQARTGSGTANLSVVALISIHDLQGSGLTSTYSGQTVAVEGIVTARKSNGFFLQTTDAEADASASTSEGVFVFTSSAPTATATVGNRMRVQGLVAEFTSSTNPHQLSFTEMTSPVLSLLGSGNALPAPIEITTTQLHVGSPISALERYEGMRVSAPNLRVVAPVAANVNEANATSPPDGNFFGVLAGTARPFREAGIGALDTTPIPGGKFPPIFDTNPERIRVQSTGQAGAIAMGADVGDVISGLVGVLDYGFGIYSLLPDPSASISVVSGANPTAVSVAKANEITIGGFNLERFFDSVNDPAISDPVLTPAALENRLKKTSNAICAYVRTPDILGVVEVENLSVLQQLADHINTGNTLFPGSCAKNPNYAAYLQEGNDIGGIDIGFLLNTTEVAPGVPRVEVLEIVQLGKDTMFVDKNGITSSKLNDRPSLLLRARVNQANGAHYDVTVIANHLRSLTDVNSMDAGSNGWSTDGERVRAKRAAQAQELAGFIHARQVANPSERIVLLGDFNAFEFNDGYTDSMGVITGREAAASEVLNYVDSPITVPLTNMADLTPAADRYSFTFDGSAQSLDHMVVNQVVLDGTAGVRAEHARINADFGEDNLGDFTVPVRVSDHDPVVLFLSESSFTTVDLSVGVSAAKARVQLGQPLTWSVGVANVGANLATPVWLDLTLGSPIAGMSVQPQLAGWTCAAPVLDETNAKVRCTGTQLTVGTHARFVVTLPSAGLGGRVINLAGKVSSPMTDLATLNNTANANVQVVASSALASKVQGPAGPLSRNAPASYAIGIANAGPHAARNAALVISVNGPRQIVSNLVAAAGLNCGLESESPTRSTWACHPGGSYAAGRSDAIVLKLNPKYTAGPVLSVGTGFASESSDPDKADNSAASAASVPGAAAPLQ